MTRMGVEEGPEVYTCKLFCMVTCVRSTGWDLAALSFLMDEREVLLLPFSDSISARELRLSEVVLPPSLPAACKKEEMPGGQDIVLSSISGGHFSDQEMNRPRVLSNLSIPTPCSGKFS